MSTGANLVQSNHRRQLRIALATSIVAVLLSFAPRHERALFVVRDPGVSAFTAVVPPLLVPDLGRYLVTFVDPLGGVPGLLRRARLVGGAFVPPNPYATRPGAADEPEAAYTDPGTKTSPEPGSTYQSPLTLGDPTGFLPAPPFAFGPPGSSPVGLVQEVPPGGTVPGVPEPMSWAMMILGFFSVGAVLRRRRPASAEAGSVEANRIATEGHCVEA